MVLTIISTSSTSSQFSCYFMKSRPLSLAYRIIYALASTCLSRQNSNLHSSQTAWSFCLSFLISVRMSSFLSNSFQVKILPILHTPPVWKTSSFSTGPCFYFAYTVHSALAYVTVIYVPILTPMLDSNVLRPRIVCYLSSFCPTT